jgi:hypothetical protein
VMLLGDCGQSVMFFHLIRRKLAATPPWKQEPTCS